MDEVRKILNRAAIKEFDNKIIGYLNKDDFLRLWTLREQKIKEFIKEGLSEKAAKNAAFWNLCKIVNPLPSPIKVLGFGYAPAYSLVRDKEKILNKYLDRDWAIWVNKMRKNAKKLAKEAQTEKEKQKIIDKFEAQIKEAEKYYLMIKEGKVENIIRTDYFFVSKLYRSYVFTRYIDNNNKIKNKKVYLRDEVMNVIYEEDIVIPKKSHLKIDKELKEMENVFGYYYIKE